MSFSFINRPNLNMDRFNFFNRGRDASTGTGDTNTNTNPNPTTADPNITPPTRPSPVAQPPSVSTTRYSAYSPYDDYSASVSSESYDDEDADADAYYDDRAPLSPRSGGGEVLDDDLEAQRPSAAAMAASAEMAERGTPATRFLHRFRPAIPSFLSSTAGGGRFRPTSSRYSGEGIRGAPTETVVGGGYGYARGVGGMGGVNENEVLESPKSPEFRIGEQALPSTRLHLPNLARTWSQGSNGPPTRPGTGWAGAAGITPPEPAVHAERVREGSSGSRSSGSGSRSREERRERRRRRGHRREGSSGSHRSRRSGHWSHGSREEGSSHRSRRERERRRRRRGDRGSSGGSERSERRRRPPPKNFLFCFPWIKSRRIRSQILRCFVSGVFLALTLAVYLTLSITKNINSNEFTILLILIILAVTIFFCHGLIRLCMLVVKERKREQARQQGQLPEMQGSGGYAVPREPIPVVLARDEEAAGIESEATKISPPAYGVWRESVRVDPNRLYWARNVHASVEESSDRSASNSGDANTGSAQTNAPRPPSYSSDDGVSYVVEARPRSIAPPSVHRSEVGRAGRPSPW